MSIEGTLFKAHLLQSCKTMPQNDRLSKAFAGCSGMIKALAGAEASARIAVSDLDFPTECRKDMREAVTAVRYAQKCLVAINERMGKELQVVPPGEDIGDSENEIQDQD